MNRGTYLNLVGHIRDRSIVRRDCRRKSAYATQSNDTDDRWLQESGQFRMSERFDHISEFHQHILLYLSIKTKYY